jgi:putative iron-dependent peroxidase
MPLITVRRMSTSQSGILAPCPPAGRFLTLVLAPGASPHGARERLAELRVGPSQAVGLGHPLAAALGKTVPGLHPFVPLSGAAGPIPSTQGAVWSFVGGADAGEALLRARQFVADLGPDFVVAEDVGAFVFHGGRDLTGFEDGTENPRDDRAAEVAIARGAKGLDGSSFVSVQRWVHTLTQVEKMSPHEKSHMVGRSVETNEELADAPPSAHVKRSAQESFSPTAFMLRRSMPYGDVSEQGLYFVAYGATLDAFERVLHRMAGLDDGVPDALFRFSRPVTGGAYWCPPVQGDRLDLTLLGG